MIQHTYVRMREAADRLEKLAEGATPLLAQEYLTLSNELHEIAGWVAAWQAPVTPTLTHNYDKG